MVGNKVLFNSQWGRSANGSIYQMQAPRRSLRHEVRSLATCRLLAPLKTKLIRIPFLSSYPQLMHFIVCLFAGRPCFRLRSSVGLAVGLAIKWPAALLSSATGPSCRRSSYRRSSHWRSSHRGSEPLESDYCKSSYRRSSYRRSSYRRSSHRRSSYRGLDISESDYRESSYRRSTHRGSTNCGMSYQKCNVNKRQGRYGS